MTNWRKLINDATEKGADVKENDLNYPVGALSVAFKNGAKLPNELLIKALEALECAQETLEIHDFVCLQVNVALDEIRQALEKETK